MSNCVLQETFTVLTNMSHMCYVFSLKAMCSVHKHTIQQVTDFVHVDLKVGDLHQNKKHRAADLCADKKGETERWK